MDTFVKIVSGVLIAVVLTLALSGHRKDIAVLIAITAAIMTMAAALVIFEPVIDFFQHLQLLGNLDSNLFRILLKSVGIALLAEIASLICIDTGNATLGKSLQILASATILYISIPLFERLIELVESVLGAI